MYSLDLSSPSKIKDRFRIKQFWVCFHRFCRNYCKHFPFRPPLRLNFQGRTSTESIACSHNLSNFFLFHFSLPSFSKFGCNSGDFLLLTFSFFANFHTINTPPPPPLWGRTNISEPIPYSRKWGITTSEFQEILRLNPPVIIL